MARKRGGLAGIWDRNKGAIKALAPIALGAIPGVGVPLAAVAGAAMGGLDRPGKGGIGLDLGGALKGGATGYLGGQTGKALAGGIKGMLTAGRGTPDISGAMNKASSMIDEGNAQILSRPSMGGAPTNFTQTFGSGMPASEIDAMRQSARGIRAPSMGTQLTTSAARGQLPSIGAPVATAPGIAPTGGSGIMDLLRGAGRGIASAADSAGSFASRNKDLLTMAGKGALAMMPDAANDAAMMRAETERMQFEEEKRRNEERQMALQKFFMPYLEQTQKRRFDYGGTYGG